MFELFDISEMLADFESFKNRNISAKSIFSIREIEKNVAYDFVKQFHYLKDAKFFAQQSFGLFYKDGTLVGVATFSQPQGNVALKGWFGLTNDNTNIYELSRLCLYPALNGTNATSFLLGGSIKILKKQKVVRAIITLADSNRHCGSIYQVCNFKYYGLTDKKTDFYRFDGKVNPRGSTKNVRGVWIPRTQKHRYCYLLDNTLKVNYSECTKPKSEQRLTTDCCNGTYKVYDNRFGEWYTCPKCTGKLEKIEK